MERFNLKKLNEVEGKEQYAEISNRFASLQDWTQRWKLIVLGKRLGRI
jgi:sulfur transfer protein SufE